MLNLKRTKLDKNVQISVQYVVAKLLSKKKMVISKPDISRKLFISIGKRSGVTELPTRGSKITKFQIFQITFF